MSAPDSSVVIDHYYTLLQARDREALLALLHEDIRVTYYGPHGLLPWIGKFDGKQGFEQFFEVIAHYLEIVEVETLDRVSNASKTVVQCRGCWRVRASGVEVQGNMVNVFTVSDGKIAAYEVYNDTAAFATAMGALAPAQDQFS